MIWLFCLSETSRRLWLSEIPCWKSFLANFDATGKMFTDFPAAPNVRKILVSLKYLSAIVGPETAAPILWTPGKMRPFCRKSYVHKIPRFRGGVFWVLGGGGKCRFYFYGRDDFLKMLSLPRFGHFPAKNMAAGKSPLLDVLPLSATAFLSFSDCRGPRFQTS